MTPESFDADAALAAAHGNRPELLQLGKLHEAAEQSVVAAKAGYYPTLSAFGAYEWGGENFNATSTALGGSGTANGWLAGLQSTWSIFDGRSTEGKVQQASAAANQQVSPHCGGCGQGMACTGSIRRAMPASAAGSSSKPCQSKS